MKTKKPGWFAKQRAEERAKTGHCIEKGCDGKFEKKNDDRVRCPSCQLEEIQKRVNRRNAEKQKAKEEGK